MCVSGLGGAQVEDFEWTSQVLYVWMVHKSMLFTGTSNYAGMDV